MAFECTDHQCSLSCAPFGPSLAHTDLGGGFSVGVAGLPLADCCTQCNSTSGCSAFVVFGSGCYLKGSDTARPFVTLESMQNRFTFFKYQPPSPPVIPPAPPASPPPPPACSMFTVTVDTDLHGPLLAPVAQGSGVDAVAICCASCSADPRCDAFVLHLGMCYLKGSR